jgi:hypothetical protein
MTNWTFLNSQTGHKTLSSSLTVSDFYGKGPLTGSEGYTGTAGTDPDYEVFYEFWCSRVSDDYPAET